MKVLVTLVGQTAFDGEAIRVTAPGVTGLFTVLPQHAALVAALKTGSVVVELADGSTHMTDIASGVLTTNGKEVVVLGLPLVAGI